MNKAMYGKDGKRKSSLVTKAAAAAFERYEEAWFNFHRYDKDGNGVIDVKELIKCVCRGANSDPLHFVTPC